MFKVNKFIIRIYYSYKILFLYSFLIPMYFFCWKFTVLRLECPTETALKKIINFDIPIFLHYLCYITS